MNFSQRKGYKPISNIIQRERMSDELRNTLWNILDIKVWKEMDFYESRYINSDLDSYSIILWHFHFKLPVDTRPDNSVDIIKYLRQYFFSCEWNEVYDFIEITLNHFKNPELSDLINTNLEHELSAYRFINNIFSDITDEQEILMLEETLRDRDFPSVNQHLRRALELLSDVKNPDYRNSIKESISAVESLAKIMTSEPKATLGEALAVIKRNSNIHPSIVEAFSKLYGYTSAEGGIRHAMMAVPNLSYSDAKFFLISCTSFIYYLKSKM